MRIGIPRALLYFDYYPLWEGFFRALGCEVVASAPTTPQVANAGVKIVCDEVCYPVKVLHGHVLQLCEQQVDYIFVPRMFSVQPGTTCCPKLIGLADMVRHTIPAAPPLLAPYVNLRRGRRGLWRALWEAAAPITRNPWRIRAAFRAGMQQWRRYQRSCRTGRIPGTELASLPALAACAPAVAVIGHTYNLYDPQLNLNLLARLRKAGFRAYTPEMLPERVLAESNSHLRKPLFWSMGRAVYGAAHHYAQRNDVLGIIHITSFGCGLESMIADMAERTARQRGKPFMLLTMDEHTAEAGVQTRLEAFLDMLTLREEEA
ncbi:MAG: acyl-CoA dehydratase activase-related protein [Bacillota bacterium]|jgi:predicted nucleotide-binding protein (sugar kinase/HSP70/actin superfamily)